MRHMRLEMASAQPGDSMRAYVGTSILVELFSSAWSSCLAQHAEQDSSAWPACWAQLSRLCALGVQAKLALAGLVLARLGPD